MVHDDLYCLEEWKDIPIDSKFRYQASNLGRICHLYDNGKRRILKECYLKSLGGWVTGIVMADGSYRKFQTVSLVARAWIGVRDNSWQAVHINKIKSDHRVENIKYIERSKIGTFANAKKRKAVFKISPDGEVVEVYKSAKECAEKNFFSYATIKRRCHGDFGSVLATDGYAYCYEDDSRQMNKIIRKLELLDDTPKISEKTSNYKFDF